MHRKPEDNQNRAVDEWLTHIGQYDENYQKSSVANYKSRRIQQKAYGGKQLSEVKEDLAPTSFVVSPSPVVKKRKAETVKIDPAPPAANTASKLPAPIKPVTKPGLNRQPSRPAPGRTNTSMIGKTSPSKPLTDKKVAAPQPVKQESADKKEEELKGPKEYDPDSNKPSKVAEFVSANIRTILEQHHKPIENLANRLDDLSETISEHVEDDPNLMDYEK